MDAKDRTYDYCGIIVRWGNGESGDASIAAAEFKQYPEEISDNIAATWTSTTIPGRSSPIAAYSSTEAQKVNFSFTLHREMELVYYGTGESKNKANGADTVIRLLRMACYPKYSGTAGLYPPITTVIFGNFRAQGYVESVSYQWKKPLVNRNYQVCEISVSMVGIPKEVVGCSYFVKKNVLNPYDIDIPTKA